MGIPKEVRNMQRGYAAGKAIMDAAIGRVDPVRMITDCVSLRDGELHISTEHDSFSVSLALFRKIIVVGAGKAGATMAYGLEAVLGDRIDGGVVAVKYGHLGEADQHPRRIRLVEAGHPVPDENSLAAARRSRI